MKTYAIPIISFIWFLGGCAPELDPALVKQQQILLERIQTREFDTDDKRMMMRGVISTFQDLSFIINNADAELGTITAKRFGEYPIEMTVAIRSISKTQMLVHGIARYNSKTIEDPATYEQFFSSLQKAILLTGHPVN